MSFEDEGYSQALDVILTGQRQDREASDAREALMDEARRSVDDARMALAELAAPAVAILALRLAGADKDWDGRAVTDERVDAALTVMDRVGIPKLRATAVAASIAAAPTRAAPGSPGWEPAQVDGPGEAEQLDVGSVDAQIEAFLEGAKAARDLNRDERRRGGEGEAA